VEKAEEIGFAMQFTSIDDSDKERLDMFLQPLLRSQNAESK
jgi:hypothetical protein